MQAKVDPGSWGFFCGRLNYAEERGLQCDQVEARMRPFANALINHGVDVTRFVVGSAITNGTIYYPQVRLRHLAKVLDCLGWTASVVPALAQIESLPSLDWQNRFRMACLSSLLQGHPCDLALFRLASGDAIAPLPEQDDVADLRCMDALMGETNVFCMPG